MEPKKINPRHELIRKKFNDEYTKARTSPFAEVKLNRIYEAIGKEMGLTPNHIRNVVKQYF